MVAPHLHWTAVMNWSSPAGVPARPLLQTAGQLTWGLPATCQRVPIQAGHTHERCADWVSREAGNRKRKWCDLGQLETSLSVSVTPVSPETQVSTFGIQDVFLLFPQLNSEMMNTIFQNIFFQTGSHKLAPCFKDIIFNSVLVLRFKGELCQINLYISTRKVKIKELCVSVVDIALLTLVKLAEQTRK